MLKIIRVETDSDIEDFYRLAQEYVDWMLAAIELEYPDLDRQVFRSEHGYDDIRKKFSSEDRLFLARYEKRACACVALGNLGDGVCELRTMFVRAENRGIGAGKKLALYCMDEARKIGFQTMRLDTLGFMKSALGLYQSLKFYEISPYIELPDSLKSYIHFLECKLD